MASSLPLCSCPPMATCPRHGIKSEREPKQPTPRAPMKRGRGPARTKGIKQTSHNQAIKDAKWAGIREATIYWLNRLDPDGAHCFECGRKAKRLDLDHIVPRSKGGRYTVSNSQLLCRECHSAKHGEVRWTGRTA